MAHAPAAPGFFRNAQAHALRLAFLTMLGTALSACGVNNVPRLEEQVNASWAEVQNQYQRRADLVPNLVETVRGFARQEQETLTRVIEARARATQMTLPANITENPEAFRQFQENQAQLGSALARLLAVSEAYPELRSNTNFLALQSQLEGTENRIAVARRDYIQTVQAYNTELRTIPGRWIAGILYPDAKPKQNFESTAEAQQAPRVQF